MVIYANTGIIMSTVKSIGQMLHIEYNSHTLILKLQFVIKSFPISGSTNTFDYPILSNTLTCMVETSSLTVTSYQWNTAGCYTNSKFTGINPECFPHGQTTHNMTGNALNAQYAGTITCTVTISGRWQNVE